MGGKEGRSDEKGKGEVKRGVTATHGYGEGFVVVLGNVVCEDVVEALRSC